jgi:four helix bundle protein
MVEGRQEKAKRFEDLEVWKKSHELVLKIYKITKDYPSEERFSLVPQMRRSAISIPANIAEGFKKRSVKDKSNFYNIAQDSLEELKYYLILSKDLGYCNDTSKSHESIETIGKMLYGLIRSIQKSGDSIR